MGTETFSGIWALNTAWPLSTDDINEGDNHMRGIKASLRLTFPNISATASCTAGALNNLNGLQTSVQHQIDALSAQLNTVSVSLQALIVHQQSSSESLQTQINSLSKSLQANIVLPSYCLIERNTLQEISSTAGNNISFNNPVIDADGMYSSARPTTIQIMQGDAHVARSHLHCRFSATSTTQIALEINMPGGGATSVRRAFVVKPGNFAGTPPIKLSSGEMEHYWSTASLSSTISITAYPEEDKTVYITYARFEVEVK